MRARTLCHKPGCANVKPCPLHVSVRPSGWDSPRPNRLPSHKRYPPNWASLRKRVLAEEPGCRMCGTHDRPTVDHIDNTLPEPMRSDRSNLQRLCRYHNTRKSLNESIKARATKQTDRQTNPTDPKLRTGYTLS